VVVKVVEKDNPIFTGKRRQKIKRTCLCGCGEKFTTTDPAKFYLNKSHVKRGQRKGISVWKKGEK